MHVADYDSNELKTNDDAQTNIKRIPFELQFVCIGVIVCLIVNGAQKERIGKNKCSQHKLVAFLIQIFTKFKNDQQHHESEGSHLYSSC